MQKENIIKCDNKIKEENNMKDIVQEEEINQKQNKTENYYEKSLEALIEYMKNNEQNPSEKRWDEFAIYKKHLSSKTIGYISGIGFNKLCRKLRKEINKSKRQLKKEN